MILSVSRRTDIPSYYAEWFYNRIKEGFVCVRNPMNPYQVSEIRITPDVVDCIVFWTKNPLPMMERLDELQAYPYYFQFTLTGYGKDVEANLPDKKTKLLPTFDSCHFLNYTKRRSHLQSRNYHSFVFRFFYKIIAVQYDIENLFLIIPCRFLYQIYSAEKGQTTSALRGIGFYETIHTESIFT